MDTVVDKIKLHPMVPREVFEAWVRTRDYIACSQLPSVIEFFVTRTTDGDTDSADYFEVVIVESLDAFKQDMGTDVFRRLVSEFCEMAEVVESIQGPRIDLGYRRETSKQEDQER